MNITISRIKDEEIEIPENLPILEPLKKLAQKNTRKNIRSELKDLSKTYNHPYLSSVRDFLTYAPDRKDLLLKEFFQDFVEQKEFAYIAVKLMEYEGLHDLLELDILDLVSRKTNVPFVMARELFIRSQWITPTLIVGETGTGKELIANILHLMSSRREKVFNKINCAAISENLIESELFGYIKGAFTGANKAKYGLLKKSDSGTLLLDELGKVPMHLQSKLLRVIEDKEFYPVGSSTRIQVDIKFIATAQPRNIKNNEILEDLLYRLGFPDIIEMPTLNERFKKIGPLEKAHIITNSALRVLEKTGAYSEGFTIDSECFRKLLSHNYVGNYRELENILANAIRSTIAHGRKEIIPSDVRLSCTAKTFENKSVAEVFSKFKDAKLKDIFDYADEVKNLIINLKLAEIQSKGKNLKSILIEEGLPKEKYQNFWKKLNHLKSKHESKKRQ